MYLFGTLLQCGGRKDLEFGDLVKAGWKASLSKGGLWRTTGISALKVEALHASMFRIMVLYAGNNRAASS